ncbi:MAG: hypothetical protein DMF70_06955, partial [Acidobacteria bacterium]
PSNETTQEATSRRSVGGENDSTSRQLARFIKETTDSYLPSMKVWMIYRRDRYGRGGDHQPFLERGYAAVRFTEPNEDYHHQHQNVRIENGIQYGDLPQFDDFKYIADVTRTNAAALAALALGPARPANVFIATGLSNDSVLKWEANKEPDVAGYEIVWRDTTVATWTNSRAVGNVLTYTMKGMLIRDLNPDLRGPINRLRRPIEGTIRLESARDVGCGLGRLLLRFAQPQGWSVRLTHSGEGRINRFPFFIGLRRGIEEMKSKYYRITASSTLVQRGAAILSIVALLGSTFAAGISAQSMSGGMKAPASKSAAKLSEDQRILHVLNRLGFGARPGDVERVKAMGIDNYITQQLFPEKIDDSASEAKLQNLVALRMTNAELYEKYPQPGQLLQQLQRRGALPADLAAAQANRVKSGANAAPNANAAKTGEAMTGEMQGPEAAKANDPAKNNAQANNVAANPMDNPEYRKAVRDYFMENNLRPAQFLTGELQMSRILRATYSERQLQEVMV